MEAAHYKRLSQAEWETADREEFTVRLLTDWHKAFECVACSEIMEATNYKQLGQTDWETSACEKSTVSVPQLSS